MPSNLVVTIQADAPELRDGLARIAERLDLPGDFPPDALAEADRAARDLAVADDQRTDRTDLALHTIDPPGSMDLDQAMHLARKADGYVVHYAIADVAAFVRAGGAIDAEARRRGETLYGADSRIPLHPPALSEDGASLLPDAVRPAMLWTIDLDAAGATTSVQLERAVVRSVRRWSYAEAQAAIDDDSADDSLALLKEIGELLIAREVERGGVSLPLPEQDVVVADDDSLRLEFRENLPAEGWNAQISLLTGMAAATLMVTARIGLLRTLPEPDPRDVAALRRVARGLRIDWPPEQDHAAFIHSLGPRFGAHQAMVAASTRLLRGSGYAAFDGDLPELTRHHAIAADYAHVTAPLRRLGDRFALEVCLAVANDQPVPDWAREALPELPALLQSSAQRAGNYDRAVLDLVEAVALEPLVGEEFDAVVTRVHESPEQPSDGNERAAYAGVVIVGDLAVEARVRSDRPLELGAETRVRLATAEIDGASGPVVEFEI